MHGGTCLWYLESSSLFSALNSRCYYPLEVFVRDSERGRAERGETKGRYEEGEGSKKNALFIYKNEPEKKTKYSSSELQIKIRYGHPV